MRINVGIHALLRGAMGDRAGVLSLAKAAERLGYSHLGLNDHVVVPTDIHSRYPYSEHGDWPGKAFGECLEVLTSMSLVAGCTERIRLLSSVMILPYRPAVLTAKMLATIDVLSGGRVIAGCGVGWMPEEFAALDAPEFAERGRVSDEWIAAFRELWTNDAPSLDGRHVRFSNITFQPKPHQKPLPLWIGGESRAAMRRAVNSGEAWYPASINPQRPLDTIPRVSAAVAELRQECDASGRAPDSLETALVVLSPVTWTQANRGSEDRRLFVGNSDEFAGDLDALADVGVRHLSLLFQTADLAETLDRMERFSTEVLAKA